MEGCLPFCGLGIGSCFEIYAIGIQDSFQSGRKDYLTYFIMSA